MTQPKSSGVFSIMLAFTMFVIPAMAGAQQKIMLKADKAAKGAKGEAVITDSKAGQKEMTITMTGLKPNSVYTVWLVNMKPKMGEGQGSLSAMIQSIEAKVAVRA